MALGRVCVVVIAIVMATSCTSVSLPEPTKQNKISICVITCPEGYLFGGSHSQHLCRGGSKRWFEDDLAQGHLITRGPDGMIVSNIWVGMRGDHDAKDVERGMCSSYISGLIAARSASQRGQFPGETPDGQPQH